ncbi:MAG: hypothetical protein O6761_04915 [Thaumarchaeota archaeon]|nr:hypothetical protein [Nitrososphaerota archaeon]
MQPIIVLGAAVVGLALLGTGFLGNADDVWNRITLFVQQMGWGEAQINSPISAASIDLELKKVKNSNGTPQDPSDDFFDNIIRSCSFHSLQSIPAATSDVLAHPLIICKILNGNQQAIAEGRLILDGVDRVTLTDQQKEDGGCEQREAELGYEGSDMINIDICQCAFEGACDVQRAHDIKIIVEGAINKQTSSQNP